MQKLLVKLFIKNHENTSDPQIRGKYGTLSGIVGIISNILLCSIKIFIGFISSSISVMADGINNLTDAGTSIITLIGFKLSGKKPEPEHPFGHGRIEYVSGLIVSFIIILMGFELLTSSISKIITPQEIKFKPLPVIILICSIIIKFYMAFYNKQIGKKINSATLKATATDSLSDTIATAAVLISTAFSHVFRINIDGYTGLLVAGLILLAGYKAAKETISPLLGNSPDPEFVKSIEELVLSHDIAVGIHDLIVHDYGPGRCFASAHVELSAEEDPLICHEIIDHLECDALRELNVHLVIHHDPVAVDDAEWERLRLVTQEVVSGIDGGLSMHSFRLVRGRGMPRLVFDLAVPYGMDQESVRLTLRERIVEAGVTNPVTVRFDET